MPAVGPLGTKTEKNMQPKPRKLPRFIRLFTSAYDDGFDAGVQSGLQEAAERLRMLHISYPAPDDIGFDIEMLARALEGGAL
jgi:hypothetical protein